MKKSFTAKLWKVMRVCAVQAAIAVTLCGVVLSHPNYGQLLDKEISVRLVDVPFEKALKEIGEAAGVQFAYSIDQLGGEPSVTLSIEKKALGYVLDMLFGEREIRYKVHDKDAVITLRKIVSKKGDASPGGEGRSDIPRGRDPIQVSGTVTDASTGTPMAGVNVVVKGTTSGTTTDSEGRYTLTAEGNDVLVFSFIGYLRQEVSVNGRRIIGVSLEVDITSLKEVTINAGYYTTTKASQTGSIVKVDAEDIQKQPVGNPVAALIGRVPGMEVVQQTGVPGGNFKVRIRGINSVSSGNDPLYIIDGVPFISNSTSFLETSGNILGNPSTVAGQGSSPLNSINPADIESIEVLKDADATAIYGSRGSNGVVLITTKKASGTGSKVDMTFYTGAARVANRVRLLDRDQYLTLRKEAFANDGIAPDASNARDLVIWDTTRQTSWQKELIGGTASITDAQVSLSGGSGGTRFSVGGGYHRETTVFPGSNVDERLSGRVTLSNSSPEQKIRTSLSIIYGLNKSDLLSRDLTGTALSLPPVAPTLYTDDGNISWTNWSASFENPLAYLDRRYEAQTHNLLGRLELGYALTPTLEVRSSVGFTRNTTSATNLVPTRSLEPTVALTSQNVASFSESEFINWIAEPQINWKPSLARGKFDILVGTTFMDQVFQGIAETASGFPSEAMMQNIGAATTRSIGTNFHSEYRYQAFFGRINYAHDQRYYLNVTARRDGSSRFGPGRQYATFAAIGVGWLFSEEPFVQNKLPALSFGKLRASYGSTGNDQLGDYQYLDAYTLSGSGYYQTGNGLSPARLSNPDFGWETNRKLEGAIELGFLDQRITTTVAVYRNQSSNQLVGFPLPYTTGFAAIQGNFPATIQNSGVELELGALPVETVSFKWSSSCNVTVPRNKLIEFPNLEAFAEYSTRYVVGEPLSIARVYRFTGVDPDTGDLTFDDVNEDGTLNFEDRKTTRFVGQRLFGGFHNGVSFKNLRLDFLIQFVDQTGYDFLQLAPGATVTNQEHEVLNRWRKPSDISSTPRASTTTVHLSSFYRASDKAIVDASFIRLKSVAVSYSFSRAILQKIHFDSARVFLQALNLLTITGYRGIDPEVWTNESLPPLQTVTAGLQITL